MTTKPATIETPVSTAQLPPCPAWCSGNSVHDAYEDSVQHKQTIATGIECRSSRVGETHVIEVRVSQLEALDLIKRTLALYPVEVEIWERDSEGGSGEPMTFGSPEQLRVLADALRLAADALAEAQTGAQHAQ